MTARDIAARIPAPYRKEILELNMIQTAQPIVTDASMEYLASIWKTYIAPHENITCPLCLVRILDNYKGLVDILIDLEKQSRLLDAI
jgi:hypothetical protein